jgi:GNAT superfamily N-acetyltransferase
MPDDGGTTEVARATANDFEALAGMYAEHYMHRESMGYGNETTLDRRLDELRRVITDPHRFVLIARCGHGRAGFGIATIVAEGEFAGLGHITDIFLMKEHRGCGAGSAMLGLLEEWIRKQGAPGAVTEVAARNVPALAFMTHCCYEFVELAKPGPLKFYQENIQDTHVTTSELEKMLRFVKERDLPRRFWLRKKF